MEIQKSAKGSMNEKEEHAMSSENTEVASLPANGNTNQVPTFNLSRGEIDLLKRTIARGCSDDELKLFLHVCRRTGLDPYARQIFPLRHWDSREKKEVI